VRKLYEAGRWDSIGAQSQARIRDGDEGARPIGGGREGDPWSVRQTGGTHCSGEGERNTRKVDRLIMCSMACTGRILNVQLQHGSVISTREGVPYEGSRRAAMRPGSREGPGTRPEGKSTWNDPTEVEDS